MHRSTYASGMNFLFSPLARNKFEPLFSMSEEALAQHGAIRLKATTRPGFPCRVSLRDADVGEEVLLVSYLHLDVHTPFRSSYAVYVRTAAHQAELKVNEVPEMLRTRAVSLRAWTREGMLSGAELKDGSEIERGLESLFAIPETDFVHVHFAKPGCYAARVDRV